MKMIRNLFALLLVAVFCSAFVPLEACRMSRRCGRDGAKAVIVDTNACNKQKKCSFCRGRGRRNRKKVVDVEQPVKRAKATPEEQKRKALEQELGTLFKNCMDLNNKDMSFKGFAKECTRLFRAAGDLPCVSKEDSDRYKEVAGVFDSVSDSTSSWSIGLKLKSYKNHFPESVKDVFKKCSASSVLKVIKERVKLNSLT